MIPHVVFIGGAWDRPIGIGLKQPRFEPGLFGQMNPEDLAVS